MSRSIRYSPEVRERAFRIVFDHQKEYPSQWQAVVSIATKIECTAKQKTLLIIQGASLKIRNLVPEQGSHEQEIYPFLNFSSTFS